MRRVPSKPEYILHRKTHTNVLSKVRFHEAKCFLDFATQHIPNESIIMDLGCGCCATTIYLSYQSKANYIVGLDIDRNAVYQGQSTKHTLNISNLHFIIAAATHLPFRENIFNFILCQEVLEHVEIPTKLLSETERVLAIGGQLFLATPTMRFALFSCDWFQYCLRRSLIVDEFYMHLNRFKPERLFEYLHKVGLSIDQVQFAGQYAVSLMIFIFTLRLRKMTRTNYQANREPSHTSSLGSLIFMIVQSVEYKILHKFPFGSGIIILASKLGF